MSTPSATAVRTTSALTGWTHGPHDTLLRVHPRTVTGSLPNAEEA